MMSYISRISKKYFLIVKKDPNFLVKCIDSVKYASFPQLGKWINVAADKLKYVVRGSDK